MPLRLAIRRRAERDILRIVDYVARKNRSPVEAQRLGTRLVASCERILTAPHMGAPSALAPDARKVNERQVIILRIWDGRRGSDPLI